MPLYYQPSENGEKILLDTNQDYLLGFYESEPLHFQFDPPLLDFRSGVVFHNVFGVPTEWDGRTLGIKCPNLRFPYSFRLQESVEYTMKLTLAAPYPVPSDWTFDVSSGTKRCICLFFTKDHSSSSIYKFLGQLDKSWSEMEDATAKLLKSKGVPDPSFVRIGLFDEKCNHPTEVYSVHDFFRDKENAVSHMVILVDVLNEPILVDGKRNVTVSELPDALQPIAKIFAKFLFAQTDDPKYGYVRRFLVIASNGGLSLPHLTAVKFLHEDDKFQFESEQFERTGFDFADFDKLPVTNVAEQLELTRKCFEKVVLQNSNEYALNGFTWFPLLTAAFMNDVYLHSNLKFRPDQEWHVSKLFKKADSQRKIDWTVMLESLSDAPNGDINPCPVFVVESGIENAPGLHEHKDQTKSSCIMSASCINLAYELHTHGKKPELARVYGLLIGSTTARFIVARPVITRRSDGKYEITSTICCDEEWAFDLRDADENEASVAKEDLNAINAMEIDLLEDCSSEMNIDPTEASSGGAEHAHALEPYPGFEVDLMPCKLIDFSKFNAATGFELVKDFERMRTPSTRLGPIPFDGQITDSSFKKIVLIAEVVKGGISLMRSDAAIDNLKREFVTPDPKGFFSNTSGRAGFPTPANQKSSVRNPPDVTDDIDRPSSPLAKFDSTQKFFSLTKPTVDEEVRLTRLVSGLFPAFFCRLYSWRSFGDNTTTYAFEKLEPFYYRDGTINEIFANSDPAYEIFHCAKFLLDCSFGLHLLHSCVGIVHSDISPLNIMLSKADKVWKIIDFGQSLPIAESLTTARKAGTKPFRAPEAEQSGIFTELSDIYSLGKVGYELFFLSMVGLSLEVEKSLVKAIDRINSCFYRMQEDDPSKRPSLLEVMTIAFEVIESLHIQLDLSGDLVIPAVKPLIQGKKASKTSSVEKAPVGSDLLGKLPLLASTERCEPANEPIEADSNSKGGQAI